MSPASRPLTGPAVSVNTAGSGHNRPVFRDRHGDEIDETVVACRPLIEWMTDRSCGAAVGEPCLTPKRRSPKRRPCKDRAERAEWLYEGRRRAEARHVPAEAEDLLARALEAGEAERGALVAEFKVFIRERGLVVRVLHADEDSVGLAELFGEDG